MSNSYTGAGVMGLLRHFLVSRKPPAVPVVPKSFSYAQNKLSERSEEQLLKQKKEYLTSLEIRKKRYPTAISIAAGYLMQAKENSMSL